MSNTPLILKMAAYEQESVHRVNHFMKVYAFAKTIGEGEGLDPETRHILETAAIVHDIGIKPAMEKYGTGAGPYQEKEGPAVAEAMLAELGYSKAVIDRVCFLVGHHHTYTDIDGPDYQILVEADFLVNIHEGNMPIDRIREVEKNIFRTATGLALLRTMFLQG